MSFFKILSNWKNRQDNSDYKRIRVTSGGAFYMKSEDIFNDKVETVALMKKLNKSLDNYSKVKDSIVSVK